MILAAGEGTRFGGAKQALLLPRVVERVRASEVDRIVVVLGAHEVATDEEVVLCPDWRRGPGASLRCGLRALGPEIGAAIVVLGDGPDLAPAAIARVLAESRSDDEVVAASYGGVRGHPVLVPRALFEQIPDEGARSLPARLVACDDLGHPGDVDFADELTHSVNPADFKA